MKVFLAYLVVLFSITANAMDGMTDTDLFITFEDWSGEPFNIRPDHENHTGPVERILIGHMVSGPFKPAKNKLRNYGQNIVYHRCLGLDQKCYEGRPLTIKPAMCINHNDKTCAVGLIANTCSDSSVTIDPEVVQSWARMLAHIAIRLDLGFLIWGKNILGQHDIDPQHFPYSPGPKFYEHKDEIIDLANKFIGNPINYASGNLLK